MFLETTAEPAVKLSPRELVESVSRLSTALSSPEVTESGEHLWTYVAHPQIMNGEEENRGYSAIILNPEDNPNVTKTIGPSQAFIRASGAEYFLAAVQSDTSLWITHQVPLGPANADIKALFDTVLRREQAHLPGLNTEWWSHMTLTQLNHELYGKSTCEDAEGFWRKIFAQVQKLDSTPGVETSIVDDKKGVGAVTLSEKTLTPRKPWFKEEPQAYKIIIKNPTAPQDDGRPFGARNGLVACEKDGQVTMFLCMVKDNGTISLARPVEARFQDSFAREYFRLLGLSPQES